MIPIDPPWMDFPGVHHSTLALLCVGTLCVTLWVTPRWPCGHKPPAPGRTKLSAPFQTCSLSRINCSCSEILTEETLHLWAELQTCFAVSSGPSPLPLSCYFTFQLHPSEHRLDFSLQFSGNCRRVTPTGQRKLMPHLYPSLQLRKWHSHGPACGRRMAQAAT